MTPKQKAELRAGTIRGRLAEIAGTAELTDELRSEMSDLRTEYADLETRIAAFAVSEDAPESKPNTGDAEDRELAELRGRVRFSNYAAAALEMRGANGAEAEYNQHLGLAANRFPLELLAPPVEERATTDTDTTTRPQRWLDRIFAESAAMRLGVTMESVEPGVASHPLTTAGAAFAMEVRGDSAADAPWTVGVTEAKPKRAAVRAVFTMEDAARLPGLEDALTRDLRMAMMEGVDRAIFVGADGGTGTTGDIVGLQTASITEATITQANKILGPGTLAAFAGMIDGVHAATFGDLRVVSSVGAWRLWESTVINATADNMTLAAFLREAGLMWSSRGGIDTNTATDDFGAFVGRGRMIEGAACACVWSAGELIRDPYSGAASGEVALTLNYLWDFQIPRTASFQRVKFVA